MDGRTIIPSRTNPLSLDRLAIFFVAGAGGVLLFHQPMLGLLHLSGITQGIPYATRPTSPFGVPVFLSAAFWGGIWGIVLSLIEPRFPRGPAYWLSGFLFGAIVPTLVAWFIVAPLHGTALANGFIPQRMVVGPVVNGAFGFGTLVLAYLLAIVRR